MNIYETEFWSSHEEEVPWKMSTSLALELYPNCPEMYWPTRLAHRILNDSTENCSLLQPHKDDVQCIYLFGETVLISTHKYGECPWKM